AKAPGPWNLRKPVAFFKIGKEPRRGKHGRSSVHARLALRFGWCPMNPVRSDVRSEVPASVEEPELARLIEEKDWSRTPLGPMSRWSATLKTTVNFLVANRFPILLWWGPEYVSIYNDAYRSVLATKHPWALGEPFRNVWPEIAHVLLPLIDTPFK